MRWLLKEDIETIKTKEELKEHFTNPYTTIETNDILDMQYELEDYYKEIINIDDIDDIDSWMLQYITLDYYGLLNKEDRMVFYCEETKTYIYVGEE